MCTPSMNRFGSSNNNKNTGGVWVKVLPCDTHRGAQKIFEGGGKKILPAAEGGRIFVFMLENFFKKWVFIYLRETFFKKFSGRLRRLVFFWREAKFFDRGGSIEVPDRGGGGILARTGGGTHRLSQGGEHVWLLPY